jgi:hypothetical protein
MSQENLENVRASSELFTATGELPLSAWHPDIHWHTRADLTDSRTYLRYAGTTKLASEWTEAFHDFQMDLEEPTDAGDHVLAVPSATGESREVSLGLAHVV